MRPPFSVELEHNDHACIARLHGEVDLANASDVEHQLERATDADDQSEMLVIDLTEVEYIDSSGFGMLERLARRVPVRVVIPPGAVVERAFAVTGLDRVLPAFSSVSEATRLD